MIPCIINYVWIGDRDIPEPDRSFVAGWSKACPGWEIRRWSPDDVKGEYCRFLRETLAAKKWVFACDWLRLYALSQTGGFYMDTDVELRSSLEPFRDNDLCMGLNKSGYPQTALIGAVGVFFILTTLRDTPTSVGLPELKGTKTALDNNDTTAEYKKFVKKRVFGNPVVWALAICDLFVYIVRFAVLDWGPKFLQQGETALSPQLAGWTIAIFEIAGCAGMLAAGWATDKLFKSKGQRMCLIEMFITALCLVGLWLLPKGHPVAMLVLLAVSGFFLYGPQALLGVVASNHVTKKAASSAVGLIGLMSYVSTIFTGFGVGLLSKTFGNGFWNNLFLIMAGVAVIGGLIVLPLWNMKNNGYESE